MKPSQKLIIAIDGYSSSGKSTFAKNIAKELGYIYIDTGAMYRAVTLYCLNNKLAQNGNVNKQGIISSLDKIHISFSLNEQTGFSEVCLNGINVEKQIRGLEVSQNVSQVSRISEVRKKLVSLQRKIGIAKGIVMDGRDIGTVVFPDAELKIFMTASPEIRAERRYMELKGKGTEVDFFEILKNVEARDSIDSSREVSPLKKASDAIVLDNSHLTREEQLQWSLNKVKEILYDEN